jgi:hypothetical protein
MEEWRLKIKQILEKLNLKTGCNKGVVMRTG